jgi:protein-S-isoprenylcysteine O-methyltransferase Ste14
MKIFLALITLMSWPVIPLFWIPIHLATGIFRRFGKLTYIFAVILWGPVAYLIFLSRDYLLVNIVEFPLMISSSGLILLLAGSLLHIWTGALLSPRSLIGIPEIVAPRESRLIDKGPFAVVRHPTYLAHTMMFAGIFLYTGVTAVGILTFIDFMVVSVIVIPLEERELALRFGEPYQEYMKRVPRLIPRVPRKHCPGNY